MQTETIEEEVILWSMQTETIEDEVILLSMQTETIEEEVNRRSNKELRGGSELVPTVRVSAMSHRPGMLGCG
jgi:hypothetical protein